MKLLRIAAGAFCGLCAATVLGIVVIILGELAYAHGWRYDDLMMARLMFCLLIVGPIVGGWWGWIRG